MSKRLTTEEFIERAERVHGKKYDYSKSEYKNTHQKVCITCPVHGEFWMRAHDHMEKCGCPKCAGRYMDTEYFIEKSNKIHDGKYSYEKTKYIRAKEKVIITCPMHGDFLQTPDAHLSGQGCPICKKDNISSAFKHTNEEFISKARNIHGDKYDYSKVSYINNRTKVCIICPTHGEFWQKPSDHLKGNGCQECGIATIKKKLSLSVEDFIKRANSTHEGKYDYSKVKYTNNSTKVCIICPKHGEFWQIPNSHLQGQGCPKCSESLGEKKIDFILNKYAIEYERQYKIITDLKLFGKQGCFIVDFYLPKENLIIEYNGIQHYEEVKYFHKKDNSFEKQKARDRKLKKWCEDNNIKLLVIKYTQKERIEEILKQHINLDKYEKNYTQKTKNE